MSIAALAPSLMCHRDWSLKHRGLREPPRATPDPLREGPSLNPGAWPWTPVGASGVVTVLGLNPVTDFLVHMAAKG